MPFKAPHVSFVSFAVGVTPSGICAFERVFSRRD